MKFKVGDIIRLRIELYPQNSKIFIKKIECTHKYTYECSHLPIFRHEFPYSLPYNQSYIDEEYRKLTKEELEEL